LHGPSEGLDNCWLGYSSFCSRCLMFFRFANFYLCFIAHYSSIVALFIRLIRNDQPFSWELKLIMPFNLLFIFSWLPHSWFM
jgi:hypothetical protein